MDQDHSYKLLFAHRRMVRDFLEAFVSGEWIREADFSTLERASGSYIADDLRAREDDIVWRIRCGEHLVYVLVEFQSSCDRFMAVRVLTYVGLLYQDLIRASNSRDHGPLPVILPIVLHSGRKPWSAEEDVSALVSDRPSGFELYRPRLRYLLIDQARYEDADPGSQRNLAAMLFRIESCRQRDTMLRLVRTLVEWLEDPELESLRRPFAVWLDRVVLRRLPAGPPPIHTNLREKPAMLSETYDEWKQEWREEGRQEGRQEGVRQLMARLLRKRFGELPEPVCVRLREASLPELEAWTENLLDAKSPDEVLSCVQPTRADN